MGGPVKQMVDGTTLAVGDAAGLVMPSNGGGISQAIISGCFAAESIIDHLENGAPLSTYEDKSGRPWARSQEFPAKQKHGLRVHAWDVLTEVILDSRAHRGHQACHGMRTAALVDLTACKTPIPSALPIGVFK